MNNFEISTDSTCDFMAMEYKTLNIYHICLPMVKEELNNITEVLDNFQTIEEYNSFYDSLRKGNVIKTSMINEENYIDYFTDLAKQGVLNVIHFTISYMLSPTMDVINSAIAKVKENYPTFNCECVESHSASAGQGMLIRIAKDLQSKGKSLSECVSVINDIKNKIQVFIVVDDLMYLRRGGRVGSAKAIVGTMMNIKPILIFTKSGKLEIYKKEIGMKKAIKSVAEEFGNFTQNETYKDVLIVHTGNLNLASCLSQNLKEKYNVDCELRFMGPTIGAHVGPDSVAYVFVANEMRPQ